MKTNLYVAQLNEQQQTQVRELLIESINELALTEEEKAEALENGMNERICNLTDTIDITLIK